MRVLAEQDRRVRPQLARDPQRLEVGDRPRGGEVPERLAVAEHRGDRGDRLLFQRRGGRAAVERVVVGVQQHRGRVGGPGHRVRRLEHLPDVVRLAVGVGVGEPLRAAARAPRARRARAPPRRARASRAAPAPRRAGEPPRELGLESDVAGVHQRACGAEPAAMAVILVYVDTTGCPRWSVLVPGFDGESVRS